MRLKLDSGEIGEMTDIRLPIGDTIFALRAGILCVKDGKLLAIFGESFDFGYVPGGAVAIGEDAAQTAAREWQEATGLTAGPLRLVGVVENFFQLNGKRWHEVGLYFQMDIDTALIQDRSRLQDEPDEFPNQFMEWVPLADFDRRHIYPALLKDLLDVPVGEIRHIVNRE